MIPRQHNGSRYIIKEVLISKSAYDFCLEIPTKYINSPIQMMGVIKFKSVLMKVFCLDNDS